MSDGTVAGRVFREETEIGGNRVIFLTEEDRGIRLGIAPQAGGEISSFQYRWEGDWLELIYRANQFEPINDIWRGRAPWLFPAVGRNFTERQLEQLKRLGGDERVGSYLFQGQEYQIPCHGFVMGREWEVDDNAPEDVVRCVTRSDGSTRVHYPFDYRLAITFRVLPEGFSATACITASEENQTPMFFSIGNHLTVVTPFTSKGNPGSCLMRSPATVRPEISPQSLFSGETTPVDYSKGAALGEDPSLFNMVLGGYPEGDYHVDLIDPASFGLRVRQREVLLHGGSPRTCPESTYFVFYGNMEKGYFCPEPWYGGPNSFNDQRGVVSLPPGEEFVWEMSVTIL